MVCINSFVDARTDLACEGSKALLGILQSLNQAIFVAEGSAPYNRTSEIGN
jgi:hypothetical protein